MKSTGTMLRFAGPDGVSLVAEAWGDEGAPPIVFAHGGGQTRYAWTRVAQSVAREGWHGIAVDLRGHGESGWSPDGDYRIDKFAGDLRSLTGSLSQAPVVVGASLGGVAAMLAEGGGDPLFRAMVLADITPRVEADGVSRIIGFLRRHIDEGFASPEEAAATIAEYRGQPSRGGASAGLARYLRQSPDGRYRWHWDPKFMVGPQSSQPSPEQAERMVAAARRITIPVLLVHGKESDLVSAETVREFLDLVPNAEYLDVADAGHMIVGDRNDAFAAGLLDFLRRLPR
jgi:pimeloyl-ACP methyl ester carboxylesterase